MSQCIHHKSYYENLEKLIAEGRELLKNTSNPLLHDEINEYVVKLEFKMFKAKVADSGVLIK